MSMFGSIMNKIFHHPSAAPAASVAAPSAPAATTSAPDAFDTSPVPAPSPFDDAAASPAASAPTQAVDVGAVLSAMASTKGGGGNYQTSIVDLLKLLDLDSSLTARKQLAEELNVHVGADGSAEENIALHKAVVQKLAENGGRVPASMMA